MFIQLGIRLVDTVPAGTGIIKIIVQGYLSPSSLHTLIHPVVAVVVIGWGSVGPRVYG